MAVLPVSHAPALARGNEQRPGAASSRTSQYRASSAESLGKGTHGKLIQICSRGSSEHHPLKIRKITQCSDVEIEREHLILKSVPGRPCVVEIVSLFTGEAPAPAHTREAKCTAIILYCIIYIYIYIYIYIFSYLSMYISIWQILSRRETPYVTY
jgi:hypothetical protein